MHEESERACEPVLGGVFETGTHCGHARALDEVPLCDQRGRERRKHPGTRAFPGLRRTCFGSGQTHVPANLDCLISQTSRVLMRGHFHWVKLTRHGGGYRRQMQKCSLNPNPPGLFACRLSHKLRIPSPSNTNFSTHTLLNQKKKKKENPKRVGSSLKVSCKSGLEI